MSKFAYTTILTIELYLITLIEQSLYTIHYSNNPILPIQMNYEMVK